MIKKSRTTISKGEQDAMFNTLVYLWSRNGFNYNNLSTNEKRLMSRPRFERLISFIDIKIQPNSRIGVLVELPKKAEVKEAEKVDEVQSVINFEVPKAEVTVSDKEVLIRKLIDALMS